MKFSRLLVLGAGLLAVAIAGGCLERTADQSSDPVAPSLAPQEEINTVLRGDVGDFVWCDLNDNGLQDDGAQSGVNGVDVTIECIRLLDGTFWTMTFTTADDPATDLPGWYNFNAVPAGSCVAYVDPATIPAGKSLSDKACGGPIEFFIGAGQTGNNNDMIDFCLVEDAPPAPGQIGDFVWCDLNDDGVQDAGEPGIGGVGVDLSCADGTTASTVTDANGLYLFTDVPTGVACTVSLDPVTYPPDKSPGTHCPTTRTLTLADGEINLDQDFCFVDDPPVDCCEGRSGNNKPTALDMTFVAQDCSFSNNSQDPSKVTCNDFAALPNTVYIVVTNKDQLGQRKEKIFFEGTVNLGGTLTADSATAGASRLPGDLRIWVLDGPGGNLLQFVRFHTSCSQPLISGEQFGSLVLGACQ